MLKKANWIWLNSENIVNSYGQFIDFFTVKSGEKPMISISCDSKYSMWINGEFAGFGQYSDYPAYKVGESYDISSFTKEGKNKLAICVWYKGENSQCYYPAPAGLIYEVKAEEKTLCISNENVLCRESLSYDSNLRTQITGQLGFSFAYDNAKEDDWIEPDSVLRGFNKAVLKEGISKNIIEMPIKKLKLCERCKAKIVQQGEFIYENTQRRSSKMFSAFLAYRNLKDIADTDKTDFSSFITLKSKTENGIYVIVDLLLEQAGFLDIDVELSCDAQIDVGFGEHLDDGRVRIEMGARNFEVSFKGKKGLNKYVNTFLRIGCRYLQFFIAANQVKINYLGLRPTEYPLEINEYKASNFLRQKIYDTAVNTLKLCMHEHYEDTPWREQGFYAMDSRNQMLCGYYAFGEYRFARAGLKLMSFGLRKDGHLDLTFPSATELPIPNFTFVYPIQVNEYISHSGDVSILTELYSTVNKICTKAAERICNNGLIQDYPAPFWNFYEWIEPYTGYNLEKRGFDLILNAMFSLSLSNSAKIALIYNKKDDAGFFEKTAKALNKAIKFNFYNNEKKMFFSFLDKFEKPLYSQLGNSLAILCGAAAEDAAAVAENIVLNTEMAKTTLSMAIYKYEALRLTDSEKYKNFILNEIDETYGYMLFNGATTFWETIKGSCDFDGAGSLCHGWSALPVYYYKKLDSESFNKG